MAASRDTPGEQDDFVVHTLAGVSQAGGVLGLHVQNGHVPAQGVMRAQETVKCLL